MTTFEAIILILFVIGIGFILIIILRDPILMIKSLFRGIKDGVNWKLKIFFLPIWGPIWLIDKIFGLKLYIADFEEASKAKPIRFGDFDKYILIDTDNIKHIEKIINSFQNDYDPEDYKYSLDGAEIKISSLNNKTILKIENNILFDSFNVFIQYIDNSAPANKIYHPKGILINRLNRHDSYFIFVNTAFPLKLIGKTYDNKKMYVDYNINNQSGAKIYFNSNIEYFRKFDFDKFINEIDKLKYKELKIMPSAQHRV